MEEEVAIGVRVPRALKDWVKRKADEQERSMNWYFTKLLERAKAEDEAKEAA